MARSKGKGLIILASAIALGAYFAEKIRSKVPMLNASASNQ